MRKKRNEGPDPGSGNEAGEARFELPEFGLAEDILAALEAQVEAQEAARAAEPEPAAPVLPPSPPTPAPPPIAPPPASSLSGPERVYAFVDRMQSRSRPEPEEPREDPETWVTFELAGEVFALPVLRVEEVLRIAAITRVPHAPAPIRGITNLRGRVLAVVDLRVRLGLAPAPLEPQSRIVVVASRDRSIGLLVDAARQVIRLLPSAVQPPPADVMTAHSDFLVGVYHLGEDLVILLDVDRVLWIPESLDLLSSTAGSLS